MLIVSVLPPAGRIERIHSTLFAVARSVQSDVVCPLTWQGSTSSQTNIVSWSFLSDDNDLITALIVSLGCLIDHLQFRSLHNCLSDRISTSMFFKYSLMLVSNCFSTFFVYIVTITLTDLFFSLQ